MTSSPTSPTTLPEERRQHIVQLLNQHGKVTVPELSEHLDVSADTIRRDLAGLEQAGLVTRVHGGALPVKPTTPPYKLRRDANVDSKRAIAAAAAKLIQPGQVVMIDSGTTALEVARSLPINLLATVVSASPYVAIALADYPHVEVVMIGGTLDKTSMTFTGSAAHVALSNLRADVCVLGVCSLHETVGISTISLEEATLKRLMIGNAREVIAVTTADKLHTAAPFVVGPLNQLTHLVTEASASDELLSPYQTLGIQTFKAAN
ncbi:MAG: DeoR/GlpR family DNA-binding transcription regulator [Deinococcota bacterium]